MFEAEKKALLSQAQNAESTMAALAAKYTQLLGHTNSKQKIHHLDKLKQDIFQLRKVCWPFRRRLPYANFTQCFLFGLLG